MAVIRASSDGLDWALSSLSRAGANDLLPKSQFIPAIEAHWDAVKAELAATALSLYKPYAPKLIYAPKGSTAFRVSHEMDPRDFLLLSALIHDWGAQIEARRDPLSNERVFSNRYEPRPGYLFKEKTYDLFRARNLRLASDESFGYVLSTDLTDFYNQISTHRVENALEEAGIPSDMARSLEELLLSLNLRSSRGIPVGQEFSSLLAEAAITMVDESLEQRGCIFTRYVDDFRIFCPTYSYAVSMLEAFTALVNRETLKFVPNGEKTRIFKRESFLELESVDPAKREESERYKRYRARASEALEWIQVVWDDPYFPPPLKEDELDDEIITDLEDEAVRDALGGLFDEALFSDPPDFEMLRHVLSRCTSSRRTLLINRVTKNLDRLAQVLPYAVRYLRAVAPLFSAENRSNLYQAVICSHRSALPYTQEWLASLLFERPAVLPPGKAVEVLEKWGAADRRHFALMSSILAGSADPVRDLKQEWTGLAVRDRRWLIHAAILLPVAERRAFLTEVKAKGDTVERSIAISVWP